MIWGFVYVLQRCVQVLLDHSVSLLYRPKHLRRLINNTASMKDVQSVAEDESFDDEVKAMNVYVYLFSERDESQSNQPLALFSSHGRMMANSICFCQALLFHFKRNISINLVSG